MPRLIRVLTPENVEIEYELAGVASRAGAALIDGVLIFGSVGILSLLKYVLESVLRWQFGSWAGAALGIASFVVFFGYYIGFETAWNGQSPGKRLARLRVVRQGGLPVDLACAALRNLLRLIDVIPYVVPYLLGGLCVVFTSENRRLGDIAAGTIVVKERSLRHISASRQVSPTAGASYEPVPNLELVTRDEFEAVKRFLERRPELRPELRDQIAARIAEPLVRRLGLEPPESGYSELLERIHSACVAERGMR